MSKRLALGVGRHAGTEVAGTGASCSTQFLFASMEEKLRRQFTLVPVPCYYYSTDARRSLRVAIDVLNRVDACIFGLPRSPFDLDPFFIVRERMGKRIPFVYMPLGEFPCGAWCYRNIHQHLRAGDLLLFSSRADKAIHDALVASTPARVVVSGFGVRAQRFRTSAAMRLVTRGHLGIDREEVVFVYHGRITAEKNVHGAMMMFRRITGKHPRTRLWIIGDTPGHQELEPQPIARLSSNSLTRAFRELVQRDAIENRVLFWGRLSPAAIPGILGAADVAVNFTLNADENFGYSTIEAMAAGLPVIGTDWGGLKDTIEDGVTGFRIPTVVTSRGVAMDQWIACQRALTLVENATERERMGAAAKRRVAELFNLDRFVNSVAEEIRVQISSCERQQQVPHVWSALGKRLSKQYSAVLPGNQSRVLPNRIPFSATLFAEHPLMRKVVERYATERQSERPRRHAVFFLATDLVDIRPTVMSSKDPRYVFNLKSKAPVDRALIRVLLGRGFCDRSSLARHVSELFDRRCIEKSLRRLLRAGIVLQSGGRARPRGGTGNATTARA
jgi:glycosyltransferase involved in cell wall biosynthesis